MPISLLQKRKISGRGILRLSPEDKGFKYYRLYLDVIRRPRNEFKNLNWNPPRGKYAFISFMKQERVLSRFALESLNEELQFIPDVAGQIQLMAKCSIDTHNTSFINLGVSLGAMPIAVNNPLSEFLALDIGWDEARIVCYAETAIEIALWGQEYDVCKESDKRGDLGGEPIAPSPPVPSGTPIEDISEPYDDGDDDQNTVPNPLDDIPEPPVEPPVLGSYREVTVNYTFVPPFFNGDTVNSTYLVYAPVFIVRNVGNTILQLHSAAPVNGVWDGITYDIRPLVSSGSNQATPVFTFNFASDSTGDPVEIRVIP